MRPSNANLLLVDDDSAAIQAMSRILAQYPNKRFATNGADALRLARERTPDLILLDADMPGMSGFSVLAALKSDARLAAVPVIVATGLDLPEVEAAAIERGASDFVTKPLRASQVSARVRAQLRARLEPEEGSGAAPGPRRADAASRVLIVDDDVSAIQALRQALAEMADFHFACSGDACLAQARALAPDLILLDARMPGIDGFEVCRQLKSDRRLALIPVVFVTRFGDADSEMRALDLGAADFIAKPYSTAVLRARVRNLIDLKRRRDAELRLAHDQGRRLADARVADIVAAASDAIVTVDADGLVVLINTAARRLFGIEHEDVVGRPASGLVDSGLDWEATPVESRRCVLTCHDGLTVTAEATAFAVGEGAQRLVTLMLRDIGNRERLEAEAGARLAAEAASRTKTAMLSYVAHEMGNPLNGLLGLVDVSLFDRSEPVPPALRSRLEVMQVCGRQLKLLLRDLLDVGRIESGALAIANRPVDPSTCLASAVAAAQAQAQAAGITLRLREVDRRARVLADPDRLGQCLANLLGNAIKYNNAGGRVDAEVHAVQGEVAISIRDNGLGMTAEQRQQLFQPFNRLGRERGNRPGSGLGLMITLRLVEAMAGRLEVRSEPDRGSIFTIILPRADQEAAA
jgi:PAS domain S-box-containing protein